MIKKTFFLLPLVALTACAYAVDGSIQDVKFTTPGAINAVCNVYVDGLKYRVKPPQTVTLFKSKEDLVVDCMAPGNRRKVLYIEPQTEPSAGWNAVNAGVGLPWDYASGALFRYPDVIEVNFTDTPVTDQPLPAQNSPDIRQPEDYTLEEFSPGEPRLNSDKNAPKTELLRRDGPSGKVSSSLGDAAVFTEQPADAMTQSSGKGALMNVIEDLGADMNPAGSSDDISSDDMEPTPLFPGE